jgi:hypothetical protein
MVFSSILLSCRSCLSIFAVCTTASFWPRSSRDGAQPILMTARCVLLVFKAGRKRMYECRGESVDGCSLFAIMLSLTSSRRDCVEDEDARKVLKEERYACINVALRSVASSANLMKMRYER